MMTLDRKKKIILCIAIVLIAVAIYYFFFRKKKVATAYIPGKGPSESSFGDEGRETKPTQLPELVVGNVTDLPDFFQLQYKISMEGKKSVFPMSLKKVTNGSIELPNRRSLISKDVKYKYIDVLPGGSIKVVSVQRLNYVIDNEALSDDFLVTDKDYVIAYSQAKGNFKIEG